MLPLILVLTLGSERFEIQNGKLPAPGPGRCVRLRASGFDQAKVRVNDVAAGELTGPESELDITGFLSLGAANTVEVKPPVEHVWAIISPLVYIARARRLESGLVEVVIVNTTENTSQIEVGELQFTVSPGTSALRQVRWPAGTPVRMRAVSDGLDRRFEDEADVVERK